MSGDQIKEHPTDDRLQDWVDGVLESRFVGDVEAHLAVCLACRADVSALEALKESARALVTDVEPAPDAWEVVRGRLRTRAPSYRGLAWHSASGRSAFASRPLRAAAAVVLAFGIGSAVTYLTIDRGGGPQAPTVAPGGGVVGFAALLSDSYAPSIAELERIWEEGGQGLSPETLRQIAESLALIETAIREAEAAILADPASGQARRALGSLYDEKVRVLRLAAGIV